MAVKKGLKKLIGKPVKILYRYSREDLPFPETVTLTDVDLPYLEFTGQETGVIFWMNEYTVEGLREINSETK